MVENTPEYIIEAISKGYDCKIDIWCINNKLYLGTNGPKTMINVSFISEYKNELCYIVEI
jgi:hypothetical protein